jgi:hypothetical protein
MLLFGRIRRNTAGLSDYISVFRGIGRGHSVCLFCTARSEEQKICGVRVSKRFSCALVSRIVRTVITEFASHQLRGRHLRVN